MKCPECDYHNPEMSRFCSHCGTELSRSSSREEILRPDEDFGLARTKTLHKPMKKLKRGTIFAGRYEVIEEIGEGGMGKVYKVFDKKIEENVALKVLAPEIAGDEKTIERFRNELKLARKVSHRNVCRMYDLSEEENTPFITMEYVPGENLKSLIKRVGQLSRAKALSIARQVGEGLEEAHRLGVVHRDLKPQNIMVDSEGNARIMDFGIARSIKTRSITQTGMIIGTPEYMSPEQVEGERVDRRSDIYSLGAVLFEMLTGRVPFEGKTPLSVILKHKTELPPDPRELDTQIPFELSHIILKCMEKDKNRRYQSARELLVELAEAQKKITALDSSLRKRKWKRFGLKKPGLVASAAVLAIILVTAGLFLYRAAFKVQRQTLDSIAVLPLKNLSGDPSRDFISDGMTDALISSLAQFGGLRRVISSTSVMQYKDSTKQLPEIAGELNVDAVVEGSVTVSGERVRVSVQLIEARSDRSIWSKYYERNLSDILTLQNELSRAIAREIKIVLTPAEEARLDFAHSVDPEAYQLVLRARSFWGKRTEEDLMRSRELYEQAVEKDPSYAQAYAGLADVYNMLASYYFVSPAVAYPKAKQAARKALELNENLAEAYSSMAWVKFRYEMDWFGAETDYNWAIGLNPNYATAHQWYGALLRDTGRFDEALAELERARELNPFSLAINTSIAYLFYFARQYDQSIVQCREALELDADFHWAYDVLGLAYLQKGEFEESLSALQRAVDLSDSSVDYACHLAQACAQAGRPGEARKILEELLLESDTGQVPLHELALIFMAMGQREPALSFLERAWEEQPFVVSASKTDPRLDDFRMDPLYASFLKRIGLE